MNTDILSYESIDSAYINLFAAHIRHDRDSIISCCAHCQNLGIPQFHERANLEVEKDYASVG
ncbi:MAG: hypothetical protein J5808_07940, partial [Paludibacteraceae bacterium]|nr:hypothetical protein [Paludibacteraceae bacterium]